MRLHVCLLLLALTADESWSLCGGDVSLDRNRPAGHVSLVIPGSHRGDPSLVTVPAPERTCVWTLGLPQGRAVRLLIHSGASVTAGCPGDPVLERSGTVLLSGCDRARLTWTGSAQSSGVVQLQYSVLNSEPNRPSPPPRTRVPQESWVTNMASEEVGVRLYEGSGPTTDPGPRAGSTLPEEAVNNGAETSGPAGPPGRPASASPDSFHSVASHTHTVDPQTMGPQTVGPQTMDPHTMGPQTVGPQTMGPQTVGPQTLGPHTVDPQTSGPHTVDPQTLGPHTVDPQTLGPHTVDPQTVGPQTMGPQTVGPQTVGPQTVGPQTMGPQTVGPQTVGPQTVDPHTVGPQTLGPHTVDPQTVGPQTLGPHTVDPQTVGPQTLGPQTVGPQTLGPHTVDPQTVGPQTLGPHTVDPHTVGPQTLGPHTVDPQTVDPQTMGPQTMVPQTVGPQTVGPQTLGPQTMVPHTVDPQTVGPQTMGPQTVDPHTVGPQTLGPHTVGPQTVDPQTVGPLTDQPDTHSVSQTHPLPLTTSEAAVSLGSRLGRTERSLTFTPAGSSILTSPRTPAGTSEGSFVRPGRGGSSTSRSPGSTSPGEGPIATPSPERSEDSRTRVSVPPSSRPVRPGPSLSPSSVPVTSTARSAADGPPPAAAPPPEFFVVPDQPATIRVNTVELLLQMLVEDSRAASPAGLQEETSAWVAPYLRRAAGFTRVLDVWSSGQAVQSLLEFRTSGALRWIGAAGSLLEETGLAGAVRDGTPFRKSRITSITVGGLHRDVCGWLLQCPAGFHCRSQSGNFSCSSVCHAEHCRHHGLCTHHPHGPPVCRCLVGEDFWFMGQRCDVRMTRARLLGTCLAVVLLAAAVIGALALVAVRRYRAALIRAKVDQTRSSYRRFNHFDELSGRSWARPAAGSADSLDNPAFTRSDELLHLRALDRPCCYHDDTLSLPSSARHGWRGSDGVLDSGKASDLSVCSWPVEPIHWTPFPLLQQLAVHRTPAVRESRPRSYCEGMELADLGRSWTA